jgi:FG-GAP-like repeat/IPT/TIG domain
MVVPLRVLWGLLFSLCSLAAVAQAPTISSFSPTSGPASTTVTVTGTNLTNIRSVVLRGIPCNITPISATQASFKVPAQASTGKFRLTTTGGNVLSGSDFTVTRASASLTYVLRTGTFNSINVGSYSTPAFCDLDHDGLIDLLVGQEINGSVSHYEQSSANSTSFTLRSANLSGLTGHYNSIVSVTDIDGDGLLEMVVGAGAGNFKHYEQSAANGTSFTQLSTDFNSIFSTGGTTFQSPHFTDIDGDGLLDLLVGDEFLSRWEQTTANGGTFTQLNNQNFGLTADANNGGSEVCVIDLDGDNLLDMLIARGNGQLFHYEQTSANSTTLTQVSAAFNGLSMSGYPAPALTDLDGDGLLDMLVGGADGVVRHYEQVGTPTITSFTPTSGVIGTSVTVTGTNLDGATVARVNGTAGTIVGTPTSTSLTFTVGAGSTTGAVSVMTPEGTATGSTFTVTVPAPTITSFTPTSGPVGTSVTVTGTNLNGATAARVNGTGGTIVGTPTSTSLTFTVGAGSTTGAVSVVTPGGTATGSTFTVIQPPTITSFTPTSGPVGTSVTVTGTNLTGATVARVNGTAGTIVGTPTSTSLTFTVGAGSTTGAVSVTTPGGTATGNTFTVPALPPTITSFGPNTGPVGTSVTITGTDLATTTSVRVNGVAGAIVGTPTATSLTFIVPGTATTGPISLTTPLGTVTSATNFTVTSVGVQCSGATPLATSYVSNNSNKGEMFDIIATNTVTISCFDVNLILGSNGNYEIYYKTGSYVGSENNAAAWTLLGSNPSVPCVGFDVPSPMLIPINVTIPAGQTAAFYITATDAANTTGIRYTNNSGITILATSPDLSIRSGIGKAYPFSTNYVNRSFNGTVRYFVGSPPTITSFTPTSGPVATSVTITGTNLTGATAVTVNGTAGTIVGTPTATSLTFTVGAGSTTGAVSVTTPGGTATGSTFTVVQPPTITTFTPTSGPVGTSVTITGTNLTGATAVRVNGTAGTIVGTPTATSLTFTVGAGSTTGAVSVTTAAGTATGSTFTVTVPTVTSVSGPASNTYGIGNNLNFSVAFSQNVSVNTSGGTPSLALTVGGTARTATYLSGSNTSTLVFRYTVPAGDLDTDGVTLGGSISLNGGTIRNTGGDNALLTLNGVASTAGVLVDGVAPTLTITSTAGPSGSTTGANPVTVTVTFSEPVTGFFNSDIIVTNGTKSAVTTVNSSTYTVNVTPTGTPPVLVTINVGAAAARDAAVNDNTAATPYTFTYLPAPTITGFMPTSGPVGTSVTITGTNLTGATGAAVGGTAGTIVGTPTATSVTFTVGAASATGAVSVLTPGGSAFGGTFTVTSAPTALALSPQTIAENTGANAVVGTFSTTDPNVGNTFTYTLVTGAGSTDNGLVNINGSQLRITASPNFESRSSYAIRVRTTDNTGLWIEQAFTVTVTDVNEAPTGLALAPQAVDENTGANAVVGTFSTTDPDAANTFTYSLVTGTGSTDNGLVNLSGNTLRITASPDFETQPSYAIRVRTTDQNGLFTEQAFTITVNDLAEGPGLSSFTPTLGPEGTVVTLIGADFTGTTGVSFNGTPAASFTLVSATQLTATVPVGATSGLITVATNSGSDQTASAFEVLPIYSGTFNSCLNSMAITSTGSGQWQYLRASNGQLVAALNDQGHALGTVSLDFYLNQGAVRTDTEGREYFDRNWKLTAQNAFTGQQVRVRLYARNAEYAAYQAANDADGNDVTSRSQLRLTQYSGANEDCQLVNNHWTTADTRLLTPAAVEALAGANWFALETVIADHFSEFFLNGGTDPLPVELVRFAAERKDAHTVALTWATAAEKANRGFVVERSVDGRSFAAVSELLAGRATASTYAWTDHHALAGSTTYYRLLQVDTDGTRTTSGVVAVGALAGRTPLALTPNPARETLTIQSPTGATEVAIVDALGRVVLTVPTPTEARVTLRLTLPTGVYTVRAGRETTRLVVE